jgi:iron complex outermembrane recepter protein
MNRLVQGLHLGGSTLALIAMSCFATNGAYAQTTSNTSDTDQSVEQVEVTGTILRGVTTPVGSNLLTVGPEDIANSGAQTLAEVLENVPSLTGLGNAGQGQLAGSYFQPTIHSLGASGSNSTLILVDGHRIAEGGTNHQVTDPNIIPMAAIESVQVLADGASSIYGSDAVAGVINFVTRSRFDGVQLSAQGSTLSGASDYALNGLAGTSWSTGSVMLAYTYSYQGQLKDTSRSYTNPNHIPQGGTNFANFNCDPATIQPNGSGSNYYLTANSTAPIVNTAANSPCSQWAYGDLLPSEKRDNVMLKGSQEIGSNLTISSELLFATEQDTSITSRGTVTATALGSGSQANPFYVNPPGVAATKQSIRWDADELLGPGAQSLDNEIAMYGDIKAEYRLGDNFVIEALAVAGRNESNTWSTGTINTSAADFALNGTTNSGGSLTTPSTPSLSTTSGFITQTLNSSNALDVWDPAASNLTSQSVIAQLENNPNVNKQINGFEQYRLEVNGHLFELPGGPVLVAIGGEYYREQMGQLLVTGINAGPASLASYDLQYNFSRNIYSTFGEMDIPVVGPNMGVPLVQKFDFDISGRYDHYSDVGPTSNPRFAFSWDVIDGLKFRGNISTSFVAPSLDEVGNQYGAYNNAREVSTSNSIAIPVSTYPQVAQFGISGCSASTPTCNISSLQGIEVVIGDHNTKPQTGRTWSLGTDFQPSFLPGLTTQFTFWNDKFTGGVIGPTLGVIANTQSMNSLLTFYPSCATSAQVATYAAHVPQEGAVPSCIQYIYSALNTNWLNLYVQGFDTSFSYKIDTDYGAFKVGDALTEFTKFDQSYGNGAVYSVLNTSGANNTFPSVATQMRANVGWAMDSISLDFFWNFTGGYRNWSGTGVSPIIDNAQGNPEGGGDSVKANSTFDLHVDYIFSAIAYGYNLGASDVSLTVRNILDSRPPFYNSSLGYDTYVANPLGRVTTVSYTAKF